MIHIKAQLEPISQNFIRYKKQVEKVYNKRRHLGTYTQNFYQMFP